MFRHAGFGAVEADLQRPGSGAEQRRHEIGAVQIGGEHLAVQQFRGDIDADPVGKHREPADNVGKCRVVDGHIGVMRVQEHDLAVTSMVEIGKDHGQSVIARQITHLDAEYVAPQRGAVARIDCRDVGHSVCPSLRPLSAMWCGIMKFTSSYKVN